MAARAAHEGAGDRRYPSGGGGTVPFPVQNGKFGHPKPDCRFLAFSRGTPEVMMTILWLIAVILVIAGIYVILARRDLLWGIVLIVVGLLVGPGGVSIFT